MVFFFLRTTACWAWILSRTRCAVETSKFTHSKQLLKRKGKARPEPTTWLHQRTLETHIWELEEAQQSLRANHLEEGEDEGDNLEKGEEKQEEPEDGDEEDEDDEIKPGQKRRSRRLRKQEPKYKRETNEKKNQQKEIFFGTGQTDV